MLKPENEDHASCSSFVQCQMSGHLCTGQTFRNCLHRSELMLSQHCVHLTPAGIRVETQGGERAFHCRNLPQLVHLPRDRGHVRLEAAIALENFQRPGGFRDGAVAINVQQHYEVVLRVSAQLTAHGEEIVLDVTHRKHVHSRCMADRSQRKNEKVVLKLQETLFA